MEPLKLLDQLIARPDKRGLRFFKEPHGAVEGWFFKLGEAFNPALDLKLTDRVIPGKKGVFERVWTQGSLFAFSQGDVCTLLMGAFACRSGLRLR